MKDTELVLPEDGTLPVPVHPVQTYCTPVPPETGDVTDSVTFVPDVTHPLVGVGES